MPEKNREEKHHFQGFVPRRKDKRLGNYAKRAFWWPFVGKPSRPTRCGLRDTEGYNFKDNRLPFPKPGLAPACSPQMQLLSGPWCLLVVWVPPSSQLPVSIPVPPSIHGLLGKHPVMGGESLCQNWGSSYSHPLWPEHSHSILGSSLGFGVRGALFASIKPRSL